MTQAKGGMAEVPGGTLAWEVAGDGPGVVLLHPGLWDSRVWDEQFATFSGRYRVDLYVLALTGRRASGAVTPFGGACLVLGWAALLLAAAVA